MTLAEARTSLQSLGFGTDSATSQTQAIYAAIRRVNALRRWPWNEKVDTTSITCTAGTNAYTEATITDLADIDAVRMTFGTTEYEDLEYLDPQDFRRKEHLDRVNAVPLYWTRYNQRVRLYPTPDKAYKLTVDYKIVQALPADGTLLPGPIDFHDVYVWGGVCYLTFRERDWQGYNAAEAQFRARTAEMIASAGIRQRQDSSQVAVDPHKYSRYIWDI